MRTIKFRAWDKEKERMLLGTNQYGKDEPDAIFREVSSGAFTRLWEALARFKESNRFILMQFTGLHDKNGKEIYEGDIILYKYVPRSHEGEIIVRKIVTVFYNEVDAAFLLKGLEKWPCRFNRNRPDDHNISIYEVIGNIYENPELLENQ
jgi:uncharacterized phage protein (TIGR01671 family)